VADELPSKTRRKKEMHALQALGGELVLLPEQELASLELPERLLDAVLAARAIPAGRHEARRRQLQYIGKLMRDIDAAPIQAKLAVRQAGAHARTARFKRIEEWRARLLEDEAALATLAREYPQADAAQLRVLIRESARERAAGRPPRSFRALFRALEAMLPAAEDAEEDGG
jgi:ribosome-associated protein